MNVNSDLEEIFEHTIHNNYRNLFKEAQLNFTTYACKGDLTHFEEEFEKLFSKKDGAAPLISQLTYKGKSIYHLPDVIKDRLQDLQKKYYYKFKYYIEQYNPESIIIKFHELYNDIFFITGRGLITHRVGPSLKESLEAIKK